MVALARARESADPAGATAVYDGQVAQLIDQKQAKAYRAAVKLIGRIGELRNRLEQPDEFDAYVARIRAGHKRKSSLIELLDRNLP